MNGISIFVKGFPGSSDGNESACNAGDPGSIPGSGRSPGEGYGNPLQYSCLGNSMDREVWWVTVHRVTKSWTQLSDSHLHFQRRLQRVPRPFPAFSSEKMALYVPGSRLSQDTESPGSMILGFPASKTVRSVCGFPFQSVVLCCNNPNRPKQQGLLVRGWCGQRPVGGVLREWP